MFFAISNNNDKNEISCIYILNIPCIYSKYFIFFVIKFHFISVFYN